jgi:hypothetical protein
VLLLAEVLLKRREVSKYDKRLRGKARYRVKAKLLILNIKEI